MTIGTQDEFNKFVQRANQLISETHPLRSVIMLSIDTPGDVPHFTVNHLAFNLDDAVLITAIGYLVEQAAARRPDIAEVQRLSKAWRTIFSEAVENIRIGR